MRTSGFFAYAICLVLIGCWGQPEQIKGSVFIVTQGGESVKLGLVEVEVVDSVEMFRVLGEKMKAASKELDSVTPLLAQAKQEWLETKKRVKVLQADFLNHPGLYHSGDSLMDSAISVYYKKQVVLYRWNDPSDFLDSLPKVRDSAKTDADGNFSFALKRGAYVLIAETSRHLGETTENYWWCVPIAVNGTTREFHLSNDNFYSNPQIESAKLEQEIYDLKQEFR